MLPPSNGRELWLAVLRESAIQLDEFLAALPKTAFTEKTGDAWTIAENLEHLLLVEQRVLRVLQQVCSRPGAPPAAPLTDLEVWERSLGTGSRAEAPPSVMPVGSALGAEAMRAEFARLRSQTIEYAATTSDPLTQRTIRMPVGEIDGAQCFLMLSAHVHRHLRQMRTAAAQNV